MQPRPIAILLPAAGAPDSDSAENRRRPNG